MDKDPVCGRALARQEVSGQSAYQGRTYFFCSPTCKEQFDGDPEPYVMKRLADESRRSSLPEEG
jgi:Cu+-exporting ATPase